MSSRKSWLDHFLYLKVHPEEFSEKSEFRKILENRSEPESL